MEHMGFSSRFEHIGWNTLTADGINGRRAFFHTRLVLVQVQVLVLDLSAAASLRFGVWVGVGPCVAFALLFLFT